ncbi:proteasome lid subunit RPN8/RPN11 [Sphingomonas zeicaulis]|uniref:Mov34/MPN/PAD-1 family protein n=1 Tax=Sphingomonas zeicaulis TaxID=1632740 RepID=UPI003D22D364
MGMRVQISRSLVDELLHAAAASPALEICGLLLGGEGRIDAILPAANVAADPARRFEIDPATLFAAHRAARAGGAQVVGHYHSHPTGLAEPSPRDAEQAVGGEYWLVLAGGEARLFVATRVGAIAGRFEAVELEPARASLASVAASAQKDAPAASSPHQPDAPRS